MDIKQIFIDQITIVQTLLLKNIDNIQGRSLYTQSGKMITESLISIDKVLENPQIQIHDRILLEKSYCRGHDTIHMKLEYFNAYYYAYQNIKKEGFQQQLALSRLNDETAAMLTTILGFNRKLCAIGSSTDDYFVTRMENALWVHKPIKLTMLFRGKVTRSFIGRTTEVYYS
jgi:hypothetical protein